MASLSADDAQSVLPIRFARPKRAICVVVPCEQMASRARASAKRERKSYAGARLRLLRAGKS